MIISIPIRIPMIFPQEPLPESPSAGSSPLRSSLLSRSSHCRTRSDWSRWHEICILWAKWYLNPIIHNYTWYDKDLEEAVIQGHDPLAVGLHSLHSIKCPTPTFLSWDYNMFFLSCIAWKDPFLSLRLYIAGFSWKLLPTSFSLK